jgi:hypothetical protein
MNLKERNQAQIIEALGAVNRYFYWLETGKNSEEATPSDLIMFYINHQGAKHYAETHQETQDI